MTDSIIEDFFSGKRSESLPFVVNDTVEILSGVYAGRQGAAVIIDISGEILQFLVEFGDGTDELIPMNNLKLIEAEKAESGRPD